MSGGFFDYQDYRLHDMAEDLEALPFEQYTDRANTLFLETAMELRKLCNKLHHIDYFLERDIGEECMFRLIEEDEK